MAKSSNKSKKMNLVYKKRAVIALIALAIVMPPLYGFWLVYQKFDMYDQASEQVGIVSIRELIIEAVDGLSKPAPIDAKTGDIYLPENRLYLPANRWLGTVVYSANIDTSDTERQPITVTLESALRGAKVKLYSAPNVTALFDAVPKLQACSRGVLLTFGPATEPQGKLKGTVALGNGKTLHMYSEDKCSDLDELVEHLKNIRSY